MKALTQALLAVATAGLAILSAHAAGAPTDFDGNGRSDILWRNAATGENYVYLMIGLSIVNEGVLRTVEDQHWQVAGAGDFNGDGRADILWRNSASGENYVYFMNGRSIVSEGYLRTITDHSWQVAGVGDFDDDGRDDILWRNTMTGQNYVYFMNGLSIVNEGYVRTVADTAWRIKGVADFDGDGKADILWRNGTTGENYLYLMNGVSIASEGYLRSVTGTAWQIKGVADFDGNGKADILWRNTASGENYLYLMQGINIVAEGYLRTVADQAWQVAALGDYDGDGKSDILWRRTSTGENYLYPMVGTTIKPTEGFIRTVPDLTWRLTPPAPDTAAPSAATGLVATPVSASRVKLSWSATTDNVAVTGHRVLRNGSLLTILGNVTTFQDTGLDPATAYTYRVRAIDAAGNIAPQGNLVSATTLAPTTATLAWDAVIHPAVTGYRVYFGTAPGVYSQSAGNGVDVGNATTHTITGLSSGTRYYFAVRAHDASSNESAFSNEISKDIP